jgi:AcrR family transcriptional regulator
LDAAERVIARDGPGASLDAIAAQAGITKPVVYARVGHRADLSNALAERLTARIVAAVGDELAHRAPSRDTLAWFFRTTLDTIGDHRQLFRYVTLGAAGDTSDRALYLAGQSALPLAELLRQWRADAAADPSVALAWAYAIVGMLNMVARWWIEEGGPPVAELADQLAALAWSGMRGDR